MPNMSLSANGLEQLKLAEQLVPRLYDDGGVKGKGNCTIGYGHLVHYDPCGGKKYVSEHQFINGITMRSATALLRNDVRFAEKAVNDLVKIPLTQNQFDALAIFTFNVGRAAFARSTLLRVVNTNQFDKAPAAFRMWDRSGGKIVSGLSNRRNREIVLFQKP